MAFEPDLTRYFERIGYGGPTAPSLSNLDALILAHVMAIPFENIDILIGRPIAIDPASIEDKLITRHRGGYCFEQNAYLMHVLRALGYEVTPLAARVRLNPPQRSPSADGRSWMREGRGGSATPARGARCMEGKEVDEPYPRHWLHS